MSSEQPDGWERRRFAECGTWLSGGTPSKSEAGYWGGEIPWVGPKDLHVRYVDDAEEHLTELGVANGTRLAPEGTVLVVVRSMALAHRLQISLTRQEVAFNQDIKAILPAHDVDPRYMFFALWGCHDELHALVDEASHGTKRLRTEVLGEFRLPTPSPPEQRRIVAVLAALDDKIDSNRRIAALLEDAASARFRTHFVDFLGIEDSEDSELGPIPRGWTLRPVAALARYVNGKAFTKFGNDRGRMVIRIADLKSGPGGSTVYTDHEADDDSIARAGDILFAWSGSLDVYRWHRAEALINQHIFKVIPLCVPGWFVYLSLRQVMPHFQAIAAEKATTMGHIKRAHLSELSVAVPPPDEMARWDEIFTPLFQRSLGAVIESESLAKARDTLLPKLISGQIRVPGTDDPDEVAGPIVAGHPG